MTVVSAEAYCTFALDPELEHDLENLQTKVASLENKPMTLQTKVAFLEHELKKYKEAARSEKEELEGLRIELQTIKPKNKEASKSETAELEGF
jgi:septal ring factor EnvC (AmiA/AmiB activator)